MHSQCYGDTADSMYFTIANRAITCLDGRSDDKGIAVTDGGFITRPVVGVTIDGV